MSHRVAICYRTPIDSDAFDDHYIRNHIPLARAVPGLSAFTWGKCVALGSSEPPFYMVASMHFPTAEALAHALTSGEMRQAGKDLRNFATGGVVMFTQQEESALDL